MKKTLKLLIFFGFTISFIIGLIIVAAQLLGLIIINPNLIISVSKLTKIMYPLTAASGLLAFCYSYIYKKNRNSKLK